MGNGDQRFWIICAVPIPICRDEELNHLLRRLNRVVRKLGNFGRFEFVERVDVHVGVPAVGGRRRRGRQRRSEGGVWLGMRTARYKQQRKKRAWMSTDPVINTLLYLPAI